MYVHTTHNYNCGDIYNITVYVWHIVMCMMFTSCANTWFASAAAPCAMLMRYNNVCYTQVEMVCICMLVSRYTSIRVDVVCGHELQEQRQV